MAFYESAPHSLTTKAAATSYDYEFIKKSYTNVILNCSLALNC